MRTVKPIELDFDPKYELKNVVESHFENAIDEIDALSSLLGMARNIPDNRRYGYDLDLLDEIVLKRIRKLARSCQNTISEIINDAPISAPEDLP
jgi:hypothetical protein